MVSKRKIYFGILICLIGIGLILAGATKKNIDNFFNYSFRDEPIEVKGFEAPKVVVMSVPEKVEIPDISVDLPVKMAKIVEGYWEVFEDSAGWGEGSGVPGHPGNQVIFAHAKEGLFRPLQYIQEGMVITIHTNNENYQYQVVEVKSVYPNEIEVIEPTSDETLTLYTCSGFNDEKRLIVVAKRIIN